MVVNSSARATRGRCLMAFIFAFGKLPIVIPEAISKGGWQEKLCPKLEPVQRRELGSGGRMFHGW